MECSLVIGPNGTPPLPSVLAGKGRTPAYMIDATAFHAAGGAYRTWIPYFRIGGGENGKRKEESYIYGCSSPAF